MIEFLCPNGHRIRCPAEQAGRAAKCPRCGVKFRVPDAAELDVSEAIGSDSGVSRPEFTDSGVRQQEAAACGRAAAEGAADRVPLSQRPPFVRAGEPSGQARRVPGVRLAFPHPHLRRGLVRGNPSGSGRGAGRLGRRRAGAGRGPAAVPPALAPVPPERATLPATVPGGDVAGQGLAALFAQLWDLRPAGATVELRLRDGETILPEQFLKRAIPTEPPGRLCRQGRRRTLSLMAVAWDAVARATVRGLSANCPRNWPSKLSAYSSSCKSASVTIEKPLAASVSWAISMLSTISATAAWPRGRTNSG